MGSSCISSFRLRLAAVTHQVWLTASAELTYSSSHSPYAWYSVISIIDISRVWPHHVTGGVMWFSALAALLYHQSSCNYDADLAIQSTWTPPTSAWRPLWNLSAVDKWPHNDRVSNGHNYTVPTSRDTGSGHNYTVLDTGWGGMLMGWQERARLGLWLHHIRGN